MRNLFLVLLLCMLPMVAVAREYIGTFGVGESYELEKIRVEVVAIKDGSVTLRFYDVKFSRWMPMRVDFEIRNVSCEKGVLKFEKGVPYMDGKPYQKRVVRSLTGRCDEGSVSLRMMVGDSEIRYSGKKR